MEMNCNNYIWDQYGKSYNFKKGENNGSWI